MKLHDSILQVMFVVPCPAICLKCFSSEILAQDVITDACMIAFLIPILRGYITCHRLILSRGRKRHGGGRHSVDSAGRHITSQLRLPWTLTRPLFRVDSSLMLTRPVCCAHSNDTDGPGRGPDRADPDRLDALHSLCVRHPGHRPRGDQGHRRSPVRR